jgi:hypothetical protein
MPSPVDLLKAGGGAVAIILFVWRVLMPSFDWFIKSRCDNVYEKEIAERREYFKLIDANRDTLKAHDASILLQGADIKRINEIVSVIPRTNEILTEVKKFVEILTNDMGEMKVMVGRIDERTKVIDANNQ